MHHREKRFKGSLCSFRLEKEKYSPYKPRTTERIKWGKGIGAKVIFLNKQKNLLFWLPAPRVHQRRHPLSPTSASAPRRSPGHLQCCLHLKRLGCGWLCSWFCVNLTSEQSWKRAAPLQGAAGESAERTRKGTVNGHLPVLQEGLPSTSIFLRKANLDFPNGPQRGLLHSSEQWRWPLCKTEQGVRSWFHPPRRWESQEWKLSWNPFSEKHTQKLLIVRNQSLFF